MFFSRQFLVAHGLVVLDRAVGVTEGRHSTHDVGHFLSHKSVVSVVHTRTERHVRADGQEQRSQESTRKRNRRVRSGETSRDDRNYCLRPQTFDGFCPSDGGCGSNRITSGLPTTRSGVETLNVWLKSEQLLRNKTTLMSSLSDSEQPRAVRPRVGRPGGKA